MILYLDSSALVKRFLQEPWSRDVEQLVARAQPVGTSIVTRAEISAGIARAVKLRLVSQEEGYAALQLFRAKWVELVRIHATEPLITRADAIAWAHALRGFDAVHLASAWLWQETLGDPVTLATFDRQMWEAAPGLRVSVWPEKLSPAPHDSEAVSL